MRCSIRGRAKPADDASRHVDHRYEQKRHRLSLSGVAVVFHSETRDGPMI